MYIIKDIKSIKYQFHDDPNTNSFPTVETEEGSEVDQDLDNPDEEEDWEE